MAYPTEQEITAVMAERKLKRTSAIQFLRRKGKVQAAPATAVAAKAAAAPKAKNAAKKTASELPETSSEQIKVDREKLDDTIRKALRSSYGKVCPIIGVLGQRFSEPSRKSGYPFYRVLADTPDGLVAVFVSGFYGGQMNVSMKAAVKSSYTVKRLLARHIRKTKAAAEKLEGK